MPVLARKIARAKWERRDDLGDEEIAADAVTADLRTTSNALSFWRCSSGDANDLGRAVLALAALADRPDRLDVVYLDEHGVRDAGLDTRNTEGNTPVVSLREHHVDVEKLDIERLCAVARLVAGAHRSGASHTMTKKQVVALVADAVRSELLSLEDLKGEMKTQVMAKLGGT